MIPGWITHSVDSLGPAFLHHSWPQHYSSHWHPAAFCMLKAASVLSRNPHASLSINPYCLIYVPFVSTLVLFYLDYSTTAIMLHNWELVILWNSFERCWFNSPEDLVLKVYLQWGWVKVVRMQTAHRNSSPWQFWGESLEQEKEARLTALSVHKAALQLEVL